MKNAAHTGSRLVIIASVFFPAFVAFAQDPTTTGSTDDVTQVSASATAAEAERVTVTGSRIPTAEEVGPNPVLELDRDFIEKSGERTAEALIKNLPVANANGIPLSNNAGEPTQAASSISLRGFDPSATLVLIDGRRVASYPIGGAAGTQSFIDLNSIPSAAIESIEVLKDGASTTYGADAVAGVVNIKFRHDYRGAESFVEYGNTLDKDSSEFSASLLFGAGDGKTNVTGALNFYHRNSIFNRDRGFSNSAFFTHNTSPGNFEVSRSAVLATGVSPDQIPDRETFFATPPDFTNGETPASQFLYGQRHSFFNFNRFASSFPDSERYGGFVNFDHKLCGDQLVIYGDMFYQDVKTRNVLAPSATGFFQAAGQSTIAIPPHAPGPTLGGPSYEETAVPQGAFNPFNPFQQIISGHSQGRFADFGPRIYNNETDAFLSTLGVKGDKLFDGSWGYDGAFRYSEIKNTTTDTVVSASRLNRVLNAADPVFDPSSSQFIGSTIPYNPFGDFRVPIPTNSASIAFATIHPKELDFSRVATLDFTMYTTSLFKLPAGGVGLAFGGQFRRETIGQDPDAAFIDLDVVGSTGAIRTPSEGRKSYAIYAETDIPIFSPANSVPGLHALEFTAAGRFENYLNNDTNIVVPKVGMRWQPFDESLTIRSTWGEGFREPSLFELFASPQTGFTEVFDPKTGADNPEVPFALKGNPHLEPEDSREFTAGIVYTPKFVQGLTVSVDFYDIERTGVVIIPDLNQLLKREQTGMLLPGEQVDRDADGNLTRIVFPYENGGAQIARGFDFGVQYEMQTPFGTFSSLTQATLLDSFKLAFTETSPQKEMIRSSLTGQAFENDAYLKWKGRSRLDWNWKGFDLNTAVTFTDGFHEIIDFTHQSGRPHPDNKKELWVKATWFFDVQGSYSFNFAAPIENNPVAGYSKSSQETGSSKDGKVSESARTRIENAGLPLCKRLLDGTKITIGCNDVFGQDPPRQLLPHLGGVNVSYPGFIYDAVGRFVYVSLTKKF